MWWRWEAWRGGRNQRRQLTVYCTWRICCWSAQRLLSHLRLEAAAQAEFLNSPWISSRRRFSIACYIFISCYSWTALISSTSDLQGPLKRSVASWRWWWILPQMLPHPFVEAARRLCSCRWSEQDRFWPPSVAKLFMTMIFPSLPIPGLWMKCQEGWARCSPHTSERAHRPCVRSASGGLFDSGSKDGCKNWLNSCRGSKTQHNTWTLQTSLYKRMITDVNERRHLVAVRFGFRQFCSVCFHHPHPTPVFLRPCRFWAARRWSRFSVDLKLAWRPLTSAGLASFPKLFN